MAEAEMIDQQVSVRLCRLTPRRLDSLHCMKGSRPTYQEIICHHEANRKENHAEQDDRVTEIRKHRAKRCGKAIQHISEKLTIFLLRNKLYLCTFGFPPPLTAQNRNSSGHDLTGFSMLGHLVYWVSGTRARSSAATTKVSITMIHCVHLQPRPLVHVSVDGVDHCLERYTCSER